MSTSNSASSFYPPVQGHVLSLISALSTNTQNHELHLQAIRARDQALSASIPSYANLCEQLALVLVGSDSGPAFLASSIDATQLQAWQQTDAASCSRLQQDPTLWIPFGQMAGLILKNALLRPPVDANQYTPYHIPLEQAHQTLKPLLLQALSCQHVELRAVASTIVATVAVSPDAVQPALHLRAWPELIPTLIRNLTTARENDLGGGDGGGVVQGCLETIRKIMEDGPDELSSSHLDALIPVLIQYLSPATAATTNNEHLEKCIVLALQSLVACIANGLFPNALVVQFNEYLQALSALVSSTTTTNNNSHSTPSNRMVMMMKIRQWVCRSIVTLLEQRTEYLQPHLASVAPFMLQQTNPATHLSSSTSSSDASLLLIEARLVALEACEFWYAFANLEQHDDVYSTAGDSRETIAPLLPQLVPIFLQNMVYSADQQAEIVVRNQLDWENSNGDTTDQQGAMKPVFHRSNNRHGGAGKQAGHHGTSSHRMAAEGHEDDDGYEEDDEGDNDDDDDDDDDMDEDGGEWTLRKCAAASLDSLANLYGAERILPCLLPSLEQGLLNADPWIQEASILALGAVADGCAVEMTVHMSNLHPYLMNLLATPETPTTLPQLKAIAAWTIGRYAVWAVEQVQTGAQGHLLAQMTEVFLMRLQDRNRRVQVAVCSAFGVLIEVAGDLMAPYLEPIYKSLVTAMWQYQGRCLLLVFDLLGGMADYCGPATAEGALPAIYVPPLLRMWEAMAKRDPTDRMLLPLMESLASIAMTSGINFQPYALECFDNAMGIIEAVTLHLTSSGEMIENEEDVDPIVCAADILDGLVEGLQKSFGALVASSQRYRDYFLNVLLALCKHEIASVRMSALALVGDLARHSPSLMEPALPQLIQEAINCTDPVQPTVATNAVWALGEVCVCCQGNDALLRPYAPALLQNLIALMMGNGTSTTGRGTDIPGLAENAAACTGRLAKVNPQFVAPDLARFILGWCDGMARISDMVERRDAFQGFIQAVYANPDAIRQAHANVAETIASILFAIVTWHMPADIPEQSTVLLNGDYNFRPFPQQEAELGAALVKLVHDMKASIGDEMWQSVQKNLPVNVRRLLREVYHL